jgi:hypothetical protein
LAAHILVVLPDHELRVALCAELGERGCDPSGAHDLSGALAYAALEPGRDVVRLILIDQTAWAGAAASDAERLLARHPLAEKWLLASAWTSDHAAGPWQSVVHRPLSIEQLVQRLVQGAEAHRRRMNHVV